MGTGTGGCGDGVAEAGVYCFEPFSLAVNPLAAVSGDFDGDGRDEIIAIDSLSGSERRVVAIRNRAPEFVVVSDPSLTNELGNVLVAGDVGPPGSLEAVGYADDGVYRHVLGDDAVTTTTEAWPSVPGNLQHARAVVAALDVDDDGIDELVANELLLDDEHVRTLVLRREASAWVTAAELPIRRYDGPTKCPAVAIDLTGDGARELVVSDELAFDPPAPLPSPDEDYDPEAHEVVVFGRDGAGLVERWRGPLGTVPRQLAAADLDGNGVPDLVVVGNDHLMVAAGGGDATFTSPQGIDFGSYERIDGGHGAPPIIFEIATADLDGDGAAEVLLLVRALRSGIERDEVVAVRQGLREPEIEILDLPARPAGTLVAGDLNADGVDDVAFWGGEVRELAMHGLLSHP